MTEPIPVHIQRFILTSIDSVPHLEAILLLSGTPDQWTAAAIAERLFIAEKKSSELLADLCRAGFAYKADDSTYRYGPISPELRQIVDELGKIYPRHLVEVSQLIHGKIDKQAQSFGDAFKWRNE